MLVPAAVVMLAVGLAAGPERPCPTNPLCSCGPAHMSCAAVPLHRLPALPTQLLHLDVSLARLVALEESALDRLRLQTLVLVADRLVYIQPGALLSMSTTLASLDLGYNEFTEVPLVALRDLKVLNWLSLQNNYIEDLDPVTDWGLLTDSLSTLLLSNNQLCSLRGGSLTRLRRLALVDLDGNRLRHLASDALPESLVVLRLADNLLHALPCDLPHRLPRLTHLDLHNNALRPSRNRTCRYDRRRGMDTLDLSHNGLDGDVRFEFLSQLRLKRLLLDLNDLTAVPSFVCENDGLERLSISFNKLTHLSEVALESLRGVLEQLELDHNSLRTSPPHLNRLTSLRHLSLAYNLLEEFASVPPHIRTLSLAGNYLTSFPLVLKTLTSDALNHLDLSYNRISQLKPGDFDDWSGSLITLNLKGNRITRLCAGVFPATMGVREIILSFNDLYHVEPDAFANVASSLRSLEFSSTLFGGKFPIASELGVLSWLSMDNNDIHLVTFADIETLQSLQYLNLEYNKIIEFQTNTGLTNSSQSYRLRELRLSYNFISNIRSQFLIDIIEIQSIDLSHNRVHDLNERSFTDLPNLTYISLAGNVIHEISERTFCNLPKLEVLDLQENYLVEFSTDIFENVSNDVTMFSVNITRNRIAHMSGNRPVPINVLDVSLNSMSAVPKSFFTSLGPHVREIVFSWNRLTQIDNVAFGSLPYIEILSLHRNNISIVKRRAFADMPSLQILDLSYNSIGQLSVEQFLNMRRLRFLKLNNNMLRSLPRDVFRNTLLEHVDLADNGLTTFPSAALAQVGFTLRYLDIAHNHLRNLDAGMFQSLSFLSELDLAHNFLTVLSGDTFSGLVRLRKLNLSFNSIETNYKELFHNLPKLRHLDLANVGLESVPHLPLVQLVILNLTSNYISSFRESDMKCLNKLRVLYLGHNRLTFATPSMWVNFENLKSLDISHNPLVRITRGTFKGLENLFHLQMRGLNLLEVIERESFRPLVSLRTLDIQLLASFGRSDFSLSDIVASTPYIEKIIVHIDEDKLTDQLHGMNATKLRYLEVRGHELRSISENAFKGLERQHRLFLKITDSSVSELPHGFMKHLGLIPHLGLDLSHNRLRTLDSAAFYPNLTSWSHVATELLPGGLVLAGNPLRCGCEAAWVGAWLRRWLAGAGGARRARAGVEGAVCLPPSPPSHPQSLLALDADEADCHASALSSRAPAVALHAAYSWTMVIYSFRR